MNSAMTDLYLLLCCIIGKQSCEHSRSSLKLKALKKALDVYWEFHFPFIIIAYCYYR